MVWVFFFIVYYVSHVAIEILLGADIMNILDDFISFDVKLGHVDGEFLFFAKKANLQVLLDVFLEEASDWMPEEVVPFDPFVGVHYQHFSNDILDVGVNSMWKNNRLLLDFFEQVDDI